jgi:hypothetical protein
MITIAMIRSHLDTLETDPSIRLQVPQTCDWCHKQIIVTVVVLGSQQDRELTARNTSPLLAWFGNVFDGVFSRQAASGKIVRVRLRPPQLATLRNHQAISAKAPCPYCRMPLDIRLQPT